MGEHLPDDYTSSNNLDIHAGTARSIKRVIVHNFVPEPSVPPKPSMKLKGGNNKIVHHTTIEETPAEINALY